MKSCKSDICSYLRVANHWLTPQEPECWRAVMVRPASKACNGEAGSPDLWAPPVERWIDRNRVVRVVPLDLRMKGCRLTIKSVKLSLGFLETAAELG